MTVSFIQSTKTARKPSSHTRQHWDDFRALGLDRLRSGDEKGAVRAGGILQAPLVARTEDRSINALAWTELDKEKKPPVNRHKFKQSKDNISSI